MFSLSGRTAFVTGAGQGLGAAIARGLAEAGARVALTDIDAAAVDADAADLCAKGHECIAMPLDVRDETAFAQCFESAVQRLGAIDVMVNNAALTPSTSLWDIAADEWDGVMAVNLRGSFFGCRIAGRHMRDRGAGRIVNLSSVAGQQASAATGAHYAASKAGILALTRSFAQELAPHGVTVNAIAPAAIRSPMLDAMDEARQRAVRAGIPLGRFGEAQEVAAAVVYLASPAGAFITGATLDLNGGRLMR
ncbi:SDR family NAD(P)-dependent oxidoreductase [Variovorax sp. J22P240]|uniref:SDR family NAD(P)-dependent oxidoreductase n=1 Tax=Variovorax sp. J22P240 TaxID=3053514 RepID=UPI00257518A8|nr:SDR family NAD(P)-dependent oxidoreductase [Variovorax sp. J22P240]MDL9998538.1 SDR family NAD(P)-dependent oxidoreductase [Variovorax sp. J22P240]